MAKNAADTRERLITAARRAFTSLGFEGATVRAIAAEAGVNPALINRYFGGKEQLFAAAVAISLHLPSLIDVPRERVGEELAAHFFDRWEGENADDLLVTLLRAAATYPEAADRIRAVLTAQVEPLIAHVTGGDRASERAVLIATQMLGLAYVRYVLGIGDDVLNIGVARAAIGPTLQRYLFDQFPA